MSDIDRRDFIKKTSAVGLGALATSRGLSPLLDSKGPANEKVVVAVVGVNGRGVVHAQNFAMLENSEVAYICDVDSNVVSKGVSAATKSQTKTPKVVSDFRRILDDKSVDAVAMATPDHWHTPMTLLAVKAGKHVYLEKPSGHSCNEDELLMQAAKKYGNMRVQLGTQRRSGPRFFEAIQTLKDGQIGTP